MPKVPLCTKLTSPSFLWLFVNALVLVAGNIQTKAQKIGSGVEVGAHSVPELRGLPLMYLSWWVLTLSKTQIDGPEFEVQVQRQRVCSGRLGYPA